MARLFDPFAAPARMSYRCERVAVTIDSNGGVPDYSPGSVTPLDERAYLTLIHPLPARRSEACWAIGFKVNMIQRSATRIHARQDDRLSSSPSIVQLTASIGAAFLILAIPSNPKY
jgi:hypothetical protein